VIENKYKNKNNGANLQTKKDRSIQKETITYATPCTCLASVILLHYEIAAQLV